MTAGLLQLVEDAVKRESNKKVTGINIIIGDLSGVDKESIQYYFDIISQDTPAYGAKLRFKEEKDCASLYIESIEVE